MRSPSKSATGGEPGGKRGDGLAGGQGNWTPALWLGPCPRWCRRRCSWWPTDVVVAAPAWPVYGVGGAASLVALFFFFGAVSPLLPASF